MAQIEIGSEVVKIKGRTEKHYHDVGTVGTVIDIKKGRANINWINRNRSWILLNSIASTKIPYVLKDEIRKCRTGSLVHSVYCTL